MKDKVKISNYIIDICNACDEKGFKRKFGKEILNYEPKFFLELGDEQAPDSSYILAELRYYNSPL